jgi:hypothetical protein
MRFRCSQGHLFWNTPGRVYAGRWCAACAVDQRARAKREATLARLMVIVKQHRGHAVPGDYRTAQKHMGFRCSQDHVWTTSPNVVLGGGWCPQCAAVARGVVLRKDTEVRLRAIVRKQRGTVLAPGYRSYRYAVRLRCAHGHEFSLLPESIEAGSWCPKCHGEELLARYRELAKRWGGECRSSRCEKATHVLEWRCALGHDFRKSGSTVEQGTWCNDCRGTPPTDSRRWQRLAAARGGECLSASASGPRPRLHWRCQFGHEWEAQASQVVKGTWCPECAKWATYSRARLTLEVLQRTAAERGGKCLAESYNSNRDILGWECAKGHRWAARVSRIRQGSWCPECAHAIRGTIESLRAMATERGGRCVTRHWDDHRLPVEFACSKGHEFSLNAQSIRSGMWCPACSRGSRVARVKVRESR